MGYNVGTSAGHYLLEMDGVTVCRASEVTGLGVKHTPYKIAVGDRANPYLGRSNYEVNEITVKHASAFHNTRRETFQYFKNFLKGNDVGKRNFRVVQLAEDGRGVVDTWELIDCVPTEYTKGDNKGDSNDADTFSFKLLPTDIDVY